MADFSGKSFYDLKLDLDILHGKAEELMLNDSALESVKSILSQIKQVYAAAEFALLQKIWSVVWRR